ncbi:hypothetical protein [Desulfuribacillus stibiiarsenatis]|nr:hypothetical protein [Desulfuribacillus stibiiarsenatis]
MKATKLFSLIFTGALLISLLNPGMVLAVEEDVPYEVYRDVVDLFFSVD